MGHAAVCGLMTTFAFLLPWFVGHGPVMPPGRALAVALLASAGAALLIVVVVKGYGVARLRLATIGVLVVLMLFLYGVGPFLRDTGDSGDQKSHSSARQVVLGAPPGRPACPVAPPDETVAVFRVRRDVEYGLAFYRNREVVNYEDTGVPEEEHLLVARVTGAAWCGSAHTCGSAGVPGRPSL